MHKADSWLIKIDKDGELHGKCKKIMCVLN